jgi:hypothetical protein
MAQAFNVLIDAPPMTCEVHGREYRINTDFRVVLKYLRLLEGDDTQDDKNLFALILFYGQEQLLFPDDVEGLFEYITLFINRGEVNTKRSSNEVYFDLLEDSGRVFAAFIQVYKINLRKEKLIHWWVFYDLLESLPKETHLADVIEIRSKKFETWMKPKDRQELMRIKASYALGKKKVSSNDPMGNFFDALRGACK